MSYVTQITVPKEAMLMLREQQERYGLSLAGIVRVLLINALDDGVEMPDQSPPNGSSWDSIQISIPMDLVAQIGQGAEEDRAKELTRAACKHVIRLATDKFLARKQASSPSSFRLELTLSATAA